MAERRVNVMWVKNQTVVVKRKEKKRKSIGHQPGALPRLQAERLNEDTWSFGLSLSARSAAWAFCQSKQSLDWQKAHAVVTK
jgi:hypothetical protein